MATPDYTQYIDEAFGWPDESGDFGGYGDWIGFTAGLNLVIGGNPPYSAVDFLAWFPNFGGVPTLLNATTDGTTANLTGLANITGLAVGQLVTGPGIAKPSSIASIPTGQSTPFHLTLNANTTAAGSAQQMTFYTAPIVPLAIINMFISLASNSIFQGRWGELWPYAMALYVAHYCTLWGQAQAAGNGSTLSQLVSAGLAIGIKTAKAVQDVSVSYQILTGGLEDWGTYQLTIFGQQLATFGQTIGSGSMLVW